MYSKTQITQDRAPVVSGEAAVSLSACPFDLISSGFLQRDGLPFSTVLSADDIADAFRDHGGLFAMEEIYSTPVVLWAFLAQVLRDGKGASCASAVADIATYFSRTGRPTPCGDTGDYCRARRKLSLDALTDLVPLVANRLERRAKASWRFDGLHAKLVDGFTFTMMDTPENRRLFPQGPHQTPGVGFPIARAVGVLSLATAAIQAVRIGPYRGKETGETALLRSVLDVFEPGDVAVMDRLYGSYMMIAQLHGRGVHVCTRLHQRRNANDPHGVELAPGDRLVVWSRPDRPAWMSPREYEQIPEALTLRQVTFDVLEPNHRPESITVVTTLTDPARYPAERIAELFGHRWNVELDLRHIKQTLGLDHVPCKSPDMVRRHLAVTLLAYNLIRTLIANAAHDHDRQPRQLGFTLACQCVLSAWMVLATQTDADPQCLWHDTLRRIAQNRVAHRPGRLEPRQLKRRPKPYKLMTRPRSTLRQDLLNPKLVHQ